NQSPNRNYPLSLHDALPIYINTVETGKRRLEIVGDKAAIEMTDDQVRIQRFTPSLSAYRSTSQEMWGSPAVGLEIIDLPGDGGRSEEHTSELQSRGHLVCRL